jgi:PAS domain S-box-containing protein
MIEHHPSGMMLVDAQQPDMPIVYVNPAFEQLTGYRAAAVMGKNILFLQGTDREQEGQTMLRRGLENGEKCVCTLRNYRSDGTLFWNEVRIAPICDAQGKVTHFVAVLNDVTARVEKEAAQLRSDRRYQQMFESHSAVCLLVNPRTGRIEDANPAAAAFYGYSLDQLKSLGLNHISTMESSDLARSMEQVATQPRSAFAAHHRLASGEVRDVDVYASPIDTPEGRFHYAIVIDVTGKRATERRYQALFEQSNDAVFILNLQGKHLHVNQRAADLFGYTVDELTALTNRDLVAPEDYPSATNVLEQLLNGLQVAPYERTFRHKNGSLIYAELNVELVRDSEGRPLYVLSIARDISERKQAAAALRESETRYRGMFENNLAIKLVIDPSTGQIVNANSAAAKFYGYPVQTLQTMFIQDINTLDEDEVKTLMEYARSEETNVFHFRHRLASGDIRDVEVYSGPVTLQGKPLLYSIIQDVTARKQAETSLREHAARRTLIIQATQSGTWEWNIATGETIFNERWAEIIGYTLEELAPTRIQIWEQFCHPDDLIISNERLSQHFAGQSPLYDCEVRMKHKDGHWVWVWDRGQVMEWTKEGQPLRMFGIHMDISPRKRIADDLRENEQKFRSFLQQSSDGVVMTDEEGYIIVWNSSAAHLTDISVDRALGQFIWDIQYQLAPDHLKSPFAYQQVETSVRNLLQGGQSVWLNQIEETIIQRLDGTRCVIQSRLFSIKTDKGFRLGSLMRDVTAHKEMEDALRQSEEKYRLIAENTSDGIIIFDARIGQVTYASPSYDRLYGRTIGETLGRQEQHIREVIHPDESDAILGQIYAAIGRKEPDIVLTYQSQHKDGHYFWREDHTHFNYAPDGTYLSAYMVARDITERKRMEDALRQSEEKYRMIAEDISDGIITIDGATERITYASPAYDIQNGLGIGDSLGKGRDYIADLMHPDDRDGVLAQIYGAITRQEAHLRYQYRSRHQNGHYIWREDHARFSYTPDGSYLRANVISRDITERKQAEERQLALALEKERTGLLAQFIRDAAHEFRTPLSIIGSSAYLLLRSENREHRRQKALQIDEQIKRIARLVEMLLTLVKLEGGDMLVREPVDLNAILDIECNAIRNNSFRKPELIFTAPSDLPVVTGDFDFLSEAFQQILHNANRFTSLEGTVTVTAGATDEQVWVEVADTGKGIPDEDLSNIFKTFWRHDDAHSTAGFGLGLPIAARIIQQHGGTIVVQSEVGQGSRVRVTLPAAPNPG